MMRLLCFLLFTVSAAAGCLPVQEDRIYTGDLAQALPVFAAASPEIPVSLAPAPGAPAPAARPPQYPTRPTRAPPPPPPTTEQIAPPSGQKPGRVFG